MIIIRFGKAITTGDVLLRGWAKFLAIPILTVILMILPIWSGEGIIATFGVHFAPFFYFGVLTLWVCQGFAMAWLYLHTIDFIRGPFLKDLKYVGFREDDPPEYMSMFPPMDFAQRKDLKLNNPSVVKPSGTVKAFFDYGMFVLFKSARSEGNKIISKKGKFSVKTSGKVILEKTLETFLFETILTSKQVTFAKKLKPSVNPIPYAAYLFRTASLDGNPNSKENKEKALLLWEKNIDLETVFKLRPYGMEETVIMTDLPSSWFDEVTETYNQLA